MSGQEVELRARVAELEACIKRQASAYISGLDAARACATRDLQTARRLHAESNPAALNSERDANARLTAELDEARAALAAWTDAAANGHPQPCTLGSLCPYCEIDRLRAALIERDGRELAELRARLESTQRDLDSCAADDAWKAARIAELERALAEARESLAAMMLRYSLATGHGDTHADLLRELDWQLAERTTRLAEAQRDAERYRWLKSSEDTRRVPWITDGLDQHGSATLLEDAVADLVIDAAMADGLT